MTANLHPGRILVGVGAVVWDQRSQVLLIRRGTPPGQGEWSLPGGKLEFGETLRAAVQREVLEETGLAIEILGLIDVAELIGDASAGAGKSHFVLVDFTATVVSGNAVAGSDAAEVRWVSMDGLKDIQLWSETRRVIELSAQTYHSRRAAKRRGKETQVVGYNGRL